MSAEVIAYTNGTDIKLQTPVIIAIAGSSGSGKTVLSKTIAEKLDIKRTYIVPFDCFYTPLPSNIQELAFQSKVDLDAPEALDWNLIIDILHELKSGDALVITDNKDYENSN